jgi:hypothetical protein
MPAQINDMIGFDRRAIDPLKYDGFGRKINFAHLVGDSPIEEISHYLITFGSYARTEPLMFVMVGSSPRRCVQVFLEWGNMCDSPWWCRSHIAAALRRALKDVRLIELLRGEGRAFYEALPDVIRCGAVVNAAASAEFHGPPAERLPKDSRRASDV